MLLSFVLCTTFLAGCTAKSTPSKDAIPPDKAAPGTTSPSPTTPTPKPDTANPDSGNTTTNGTNPDVITTASIVNNSGAFENAIGSDGTWIIAIINDLSIDKELVLDGEFKNNRGEIQRKIALYTQDENRNITNRLTLTAPKLTINSPKASIQHGTFKGDLYVLVPDFQLVDTTVDGNIYFATDEAMSTFKMDGDSTVTGKQEVQL